jgi:hypothetical protein
MKELNPKRKKFCRLIANGETGAGAYRKAYKNKNNNTCKRNAHRLLQQPAVMVFLSFTPPPPPNKKKERVLIKRAKTPYGHAMDAKRAREAQYAKEEKERSQRLGYSADEEMSTEECRIVLSRIARGSVYKTRYIVCKGEVLEKPVSPTFAQQKACIVELNKMRGVYKKALTDLEEGMHPEFLNIWAV